MRGTFQQTTGGDVPLEPYWEIWNQGGPFIGDIGGYAPHGRVTVEAGWYLQTENVPAFKRGPVRWWQRKLNDQVETEIPNVKNIQIERSLDTDTASCTITIYNQNMTQLGVTELGQPGYYTFNRGDSPESHDRWNHNWNEWHSIIVPNALIRTYQGYGGRSLSIDQAITSAHILMTGVWLIDEVRIDSNGMMTLRCRDMAKLLTDQMLYPPLMPNDRKVYPLHYKRWDYSQPANAGTAPPSPSSGTSESFRDKRSIYGVFGASEASSTDVQTGTSNGSVHGHKPSHAFDNVDETFWLSWGHASPNAASSYEWIEVNVNEVMNAVNVTPWGGGYQMYVSVMVDGVWQPGAGGTIPYSGTDYTGADDAAIPAVAVFGVPWEEQKDYVLPEEYNAQKIRLTFTNLTLSPWEGEYRAGVRRVRARHAPIGAAQPKVTGNYLDYADIIREILLWAGFWLQGDLRNDGIPAVFGVINNTGAYAEEPIDHALFDKKPCIQAITALKEIVGYHFWINELGEAHFEPPNWWISGNTLHTGERIDYIPVIDERVNLTEYAVSATDRSVRSEIIIATEEPTADYAATKAVKYVPRINEFLRGMVKVASWTNGKFANEDEQKLMAELIALHAYYAQRQGSITCAAQPAIQINDQVRVYERLTSETHVHYVKGISTNMDLETGQYTMTLTTHWLGEQDGQHWNLDRFEMSDLLKAFLEKLASNSLQGTIFLLKDEGVKRHA
jgi:hypothetical protein